MNPHYFAYPAGSFLLHAGAYLVAWLFSPQPTLAEFRAHFWVAPQSLILVSRCVTLATALLAVWGCGRLAAEFARQVGARATRRPAAWIATAAVAASLLHVANSRWTTVDAPLVAAATLGMVLALRHRRRGGWGSAAGSALAIGIAASFKYYGALFASALALAVVLRACDERATSPRCARWRSSAARLAAAGLLTAATFLAAAPYTLLDFTTFQSDFATLRTHMEGGHFGHDPTRSGAAVYAAHLLSPQVGPWLLIAAALGGLLALRQRTGRAALAIVVVPALLHFALIAQFRAQPVDYLLALLPTLAAGAGVAAAGAAAWVALRTGRRTALVALLALATPLLAGATAAWQQGNALSRPDSRVVMRQWIEANLAPGTLIAADTWLDLPLTVECLEQMRAAKASGDAIPQRRARDEPLEALDAKLAAARGDAGRRAFDFAYLSPIEIGLRDELFALLGEHGGRWLVLDGSRANRAARSGPALAELTEWYRRHLDGPQVVLRIDAADGKSSGPPLALLDLTLPLAPATR